MRQQTLSARSISLAGILGAITVVLGSTPIGFIQIPPISITIMHVPTILAGVLQGPVIGGLVGAMFGGFSMWQAQTSVNPLDKLIFSNPLIALVPRILVGIVAYYVYKVASGRAGKVTVPFLVGGLFGYTAHTFLPGAPALRLVASGAVALGVAYIAHLANERYGQAALAAAAGSLTNTVLVLGLIVAFGFLPGEVALGIGVVNGLPEAAAAVVLTGLIHRAVGQFAR